MASFTGIYGTAIKFPYRLFLMPWVQRSSCISCAKGRDYSSDSSPVQYIPKGSTRVKQNEEAASLRLDKRHNLSELEVDCSLTSSRRLLKVESKNYDSRMSDINCEVEEEIDGDLFPTDVGGFVEGNDEIVEDRGEVCRGLQSGRGLQDAEKSAIELLACRAFTAVELKKKLLGKRFPLDIVDAVVTDFESRGLLNDCLYAETFSRSRWSSSSWGPRRIRQALFKKGVSGADADRAIKLVFENDETDEDQEHGIAMSKLAIDQLYIQVSKQWQRSQGVPQETRKSRIVRWLQYRGFNWSVIKYILKKLESECPS